MPSERKTPPDAAGFDFSSFPPDTCFHERRSGRDRRQVAPTTPDPGAPSDETKRPARRKQDRRRRVDPTTFEKQYTPDELEFMNAMQYFKVQTGKTFPSYSEVLGVAFSLGYRRVPTVPSTDEPRS